MLNFLLGSLFGGTMGVITMCLCTAAKWGDEHLKQPLAFSPQPLACRERHPRRPEKSNLLLCTTLLSKKAAQSNCTALSQFLLLFRNFDKLLAHIRLECLWNTDRTVLVEIILEECDEHSRRCNYRIIKCMSKILLAVFTLNPDP